jgi:hypothetical protein
MLGRFGPYEVIAHVASVWQWNQWWPEPEAGSREADLTFAGASNHRVTDLVVTDGGPPLPPDQWPRFGADIAQVGPASSQ